jgi:hypothetical protein
MHVAEDVREGKRLQHKEAIEQKRDLYQWIDQRISAMVDKVKENNGKTNNVISTKIGSQIQEENCQTPLPCS